MHYTPLSERKGFVLDQLSTAGISDLEFITEFDREDLTDEDLLKYDKDPDVHKRVSEISRRPHGFAGSLQYNYEQMSLSSVSLNLKHLEAFKRFLDQDLDFALFLE